MWVFFKKTRKGKHRNDVNLYNLQVPDVCPGGMPTFTGMQWVRNQCKESEHSNSCASRCSNGISRNRICIEEGLTLMDWEAILDKWGIGLGLLLVLGGYLRTIIRWIKGLVTTDLVNLGEQLSQTRAELSRLRTDVARLDTYLRAKIDGDLNLDRVSNKKHREDF